MKIYPSHYSRGMVLSTCLLTALLAVAVHICIGAMLSSPAGSPRFAGMCAAALVITGSAAFAFISQVTAVRLTPEAVVIDKMCGSVTIARAEITAASRKAGIMRDVRILGISGLCGHIGWFRDNGGKYLAFATDGDSLVEIRTTGRRYVVSCTTPDTFLADLAAPAA